MTLCFQFDETTKKWEWIQSESFTELSESPLLTLPYPQEISGHGGHGYRYLFMSYEAEFPVWLFEGKVVSFFEGWGEILRRNEN